MSVKDFIQGKDVSGDISGILSRIHKKGPVQVEDFEKLAYFKIFHPQVFRQFENKLIYLMGLFYKAGNPNSLIEEIYSIFSDSIKQETGRRFTPVQAGVFKKIKEKKYFSFSAPTSSGKSYLFRELILNAIGDIVIVVPSRALISEYIYSVKELLKHDKSVLILQFIEDINKNRTKRRIFIITPERGEDLFEIKESINAELFLFDESQISEEEIRGMKFDSFVRRVDRIFPQAKKVFSHPFVRNPEAQLLKHDFNNGDDGEAIKYDQISVGKVYLSHNKGEYLYFSPFENAQHRTFYPLNKDIVQETLINNGTLLVYISKNRIYNGLYKDDFAKYIDICKPIDNAEAKELIEELREFIGATEEFGQKHSHMVDMMEKGIVVHHGSMPLHARLIIETFVNRNFAKICFATSTLTQGINMPFDIVWINNFRFIGNDNRRRLELKNLMGRAGRSKPNRNTFDYGYVIIEKPNLNLFCSRINREPALSESSLLDDELDDLPVDLQDIAEAIKSDTFDNELHLTKGQVDRLKQSNIDNDIRLILDSLLINNTPISGNEYYKIDKKIRSEIKDAFKRIFICHLRKNELTKAEASVLSVSIPILLWRIQGKSFKEIISLRHAFLTDKDQQREIQANLKKGNISASDAQRQISNINIYHSTKASSLPNINATVTGIFPANTPITKFDYDILVYDTYDYLDKVISLSLSDPLSAAFYIYHIKHGDNRALTMRNYIRYGTNDPVEIWLLRYGFGFEDIDWIKEHIHSIDEKEIIFLSSVKALTRTQYEIIERYID